MDIKIVSSLDKVFAYFGPTLFIEEYSMLKNERYHLQLCIYNDEWRKTEVKVEVKGSLAKYCQLRIGDNVPAETTNYSSSYDYYIFDRGESRLYPDILRPFEYGDVMIPSKQWKSVWCTIHCPSGLPTGKHTLIFAVDVPEKDTMTAELNVEVMDVSLPESDLFYTNWLLESFIGREKVLELLHNEGVRGWKEYPRDAKWHIMFREKLNKMVGEYCR